uniref:Putative secreted peptide n=1 Tax=Anopheles braziliensis TaxID=58242 RepID=A0A2M3ZX95_9DIPT
MALVASRLHFALLLPHFLPVEAGKESGDDVNITLTGGRTVKCRESGLYSNQSHARRSLTLRVQCMK